MIKNILLLLRVPWPFFFDLHPRNLTWIPKIAMFEDTSSKPSFLVSMLDFWGVSFAFDLQRFFTNKVLDLSKSRRFFFFRFSFRHIFFGKSKICEKARFDFATCNSMLTFIKYLTFISGPYSWLKVRPWWWRWPTWRKVHCGTLEPFQQTQYALHQHHRQRLGILKSLLFGVQWIMNPCFWNWLQKWQVFLIITII